MVTADAVKVSKLLAPIVPTQILCIGLNYRQHAAESGAKVPEQPVLFARVPGDSRRSARSLVRERHRAGVEADPVAAQEIALSITRAAGQIDTAILRVSATEEAYELASQALAGELKKLQAGTTSTFVVLNLQTSLATIEINRARAKADHRKAIALYEQELGVTLSRHNIDLLTYPAPRGAR